MKLDPESEYGDTYILNSGREVYANCAYIGINPNMELSDGYDGCPDDREWTREEKQELADFMIALWQQYKEEQA